MYSVEKNEVLSSAPDRLGLDVPEDVPLVEFMYHVFTRMPRRTRGCTSGGVCVGLPCIDSYAR